MILYIDVSICFKMGLCWAEACLLLLGWFGLLKSWSSYVRAKLEQALLPHANPARPNSMLYQLLYIDSDNGSRKLEIKLYYNSRKKC
jgi:hypothetical protein